MKSRKWGFLLGVGFLVAAMVAGVLLGINFDEGKEVEEGPESRGLPVVEINLNGVSLDEVKEQEKWAKYYDNEVVTWEDGVATEYSGVELRGRGNSTWGQPKKPFQLRINPAEEFLGMSRGKKWVFLANHLDASYLRGDIGFKVAEMLEANYVERGRHAEVYFDGEYEGLYYVVRRVGIGKNGVDLRRQDGLLVELDNLHRNPDEACYRTYAGNCLVVKDSVTDDVARVNLAMTGLLTDFNQLEMAAKQKNFARVAELADVDDLVKYFLVSELIVNPDAYSTSFYWYKDGVNDKLHAGPVWDFDLALANPKWVWSEDEEIFSPTRLMARRAEVFGENGHSEDGNTERLMYWLMEMPEFQAEVRRVFDGYLAGRSEELMAAVRQTAEQIREAALADAEKWEKEDFEASVEGILEWLQVRYEFLEKTFGNDGIKAANVI